MITLEPLPQFVLDNLEQADRVAQEVRPFLAQIHAAVEIAEPAIRAGEQAIRATEDEVRFWATATLRRQSCRR